MIYFRLETCKFSSCLVSDIVWRHFVWWHFVWWHFVWRHTCIFLSGTEYYRVFLSCRLHLFDWSTESDSIWLEVSFYRVLLLWLKTGLWAIGTNRLFWTPIPFPCKYTWSTVLACLLLRTNLYRSSEVTGCFATFHTSFLYATVGGWAFFTRLHEPSSCWGAEKYRAECQIVPWEVSAWPKVWAVATSHR